MESLQQVERRRKSVKNVSQITKAMELVAATKMRRSQAIALASRPYAVTALELLKRLLQESLDYVPPLLAPREIKKTLVVLVTSDKGLAGAFNTNVLKQFEEFLKTPKTSEHLYLAVGARAHDFLEKNKLPRVTSFTHFGDYTTVEEIKPLADEIINGYTSGAWDEVVILSTHFVNALKQKVVVGKIFPIDAAELEKSVREILPVRNTTPEIALKTHKEKPQEYIIEPSPQTALDLLLPHIVMMHIYHVMLEANASEHSARRMAMKNASENAEELKDELTLLYNKSRQATITREIIEIASGAESLGN